ncbi:GNAT family N-acetyltransferase [Enterovibrio sp. ZSDZ35]|uniref:GNAT family N-acetyltransferase n=1 Tax=Enterovibrio qingdaonensis TaxID=2899818 RepID=A0ABT5QSS5_9GAMM|nr:GNAT family N-acetyltransferase [Enterovibrio sp. ZSDZ35]MDD1783331.1 GNAT family N-acetyltransferase [Enterovibrio sp. ZSDZ35]
MKIDTDRLGMTQITAEDWELFQSLNRDSVVISLCFDEPSSEEIKASFESRLPVWNKTSKHWLCLTITLKDTGEKIGVTGFRIHDGAAEVGFLIQPTYHGLGYGAESLKALLEWAYQEHDLQSFNAVVTEGNIGSEKVLTKCGFTLKDVMPNAYEIGGKLYADHIYQCEKIVL